MKIDMVRSGCQFVCWVWVAITLLPAEAPAQDAIYQLRANGRTNKVSGKITDVSPEGATVDGKQIAAADIKRLYYSKEPTEVNRAREQMEQGRFADAIEEVGKIAPSKIDQQLKAELDFIQAYANSQISLRGGNITPQVAGKQLGEYIDAFPNSLHLYPALEQFGKQLFAFGKPGLAAQEFEKLARCNWPEYQLKGRFQLGKALLETGDVAGANAAFESILAVQANDDLTQTYQSLAKCEIARTSAMQGSPDAGLKAISEMIAKENSDDNLLFAHLYNAQGALAEQAGQWKQARDAYLHTQLLYASESEPHAESLFRLTSIWLKLDETDRANTARDLLKSRYRNSYWAGKL